MNSNSIIDAACEVLAKSDPKEKTDLARQMYIEWQDNSLPIPDLTRNSVDLELPTVPGRPDRPHLVNPRDVKRRRLGTVEGRISLLHAIAHIEFNAINLAADMVARFATDTRIQEDQRHKFVSDWVSVCNDEAQHFLMIESRLLELGSRYGDLPAHDGLWEAAISTKDDLAARLVVAPMVLEARGLDVTPKMIKNLKQTGDLQSAEILMVILSEEIAHVAAGTHWFHHICRRENRSEIAYFQALLAVHFKGSLKPPFNVEARNLAGLSRSLYEPQFANN